MNSDSVESFRRNFQKLCLMITEYVTFDNYVQGEGRKVRRGSVSCHVEVTLVRRNTVVVVLVVGIVSKHGA